MIIKELLDYITFPANNQVKSNERTALTVKFGLSTSNLEQDLNIVAVNNYNRWEMKPACKHFKSLLENLFGLFFGFWFSFLRSVASVEAQESPREEKREGGCGLQEVKYVLLRRLN